MPNSIITYNLKKTNDLIKNAIQKSGRKEDEVKLVAVSKKKSIDEIETALAGGQQLFGENYVQELLEKQSNKRLQNVRWHFIGHLQSNKINQIIDKVDLIHSVSSLSTLNTLSLKAKKKNITTNFLFEVNISKENSKQGFSEIDIEQAVENSLMLPHIICKGIMTIGSNDTSKIKNEFKKMNTIFHILQKTSPNITELSMGMSNDFEIAIDYGATYIRIGTAIFGERQ